MRDSANYSQVVEQYLGAQEQRLRNKGAEQDYYQEYYDDALVTQDVWNNYRDGFIEGQKALVNTYLTQGSTGVAEYIGTDEVVQS